MKLTIEEIEEIEARQKKAIIGCGIKSEYELLVEREIPRLTADNKRLRRELNVLAGATKAVS